SFDEATRLRRTAFFLVAPARCPVAAELRNPGPSKAYKDPQKSHPSFAGSAVVSCKKIMCLKDKANSVQMRLIRVFPRKTKATPPDALAYFGPPDFFAEADEVHVSVTFTYDKPEAERLAEQWRVVAPVKVAGLILEM